MKKLFALFFSVIAIFAFSVNKLKSRTTQSTNQQENFTNRVNRLNKEAADIGLGYKQLICDAQKLNSDIEELSVRLEETIHKIDNRKITHRNLDIAMLIFSGEELSKRCKVIENKRKKLDDKHTAVVLQLKKDLKLKELVDLNDLYEMIDKWNTIADDHSRKVAICESKVHAINSRIAKLPYKNKN